MYSSIPTEGERLVRWERNEKRGSVRLLPGMTESIIKNKKEDSKQHLHRRGRRGPEWP